MAIKYTEKGYGLHEAIKAAGYFLQESSGVWISDNDEEVQKIIDNFVEDPLYELERKANEYIEFGGKLADTVTAKGWAKNTALAYAGTPLSADKMASVLSQSASIDRALRTGALFFAKQLLINLKKALPEYSEIVDYGVSEINKQCEVSNE